MRIAAVAAGLLCAVAFAACESSDSTPTQEVDAEVAEELEAGKDVYAQSGCGACHRIGDNGNDGPGPELTEIGRRLPPAAIERSLVVGPGIMPSYEALAPRKRDDLVAFLASLD